MFKSKSVNITGGPILKSLIIYAIPIILGSLVQITFNAADLAVVGNMGSTTDSAAVSGVSSIVHLLVTSSVGLATGVNVVLARAIGQRDDKRTSTVVSTALIFAFFLSLAITAALIGFAEPLLRAIDCPEDCFEGSLLYLRIYSIGIPAILLYNFGAAIIRTSGDSQRTFIYIVAAGILNVALNFILCLVLPSKVAAVAIATVASQFLSAFLALFHLMRMRGALKFNLKKLSFSFHELGIILKIGIPSAFSTALYSLSNLQLQTAINSYGSAAVAGSGAVVNYEGFVSGFYGGFQAAIVPFVGQNIGAGDPARVRKSIFSATTLSFSTSLILGVGMYLFGHPLLEIFLPDNPAAIEYGMARMKVILPFEFVAALFGCFSSIMQAFGYSFVPMINTVITVFGFRTVWMQFIYPVLVENYGKRIEFVFVCFTVSWVLTLIVHAVTFLFVYAKYKKGKVLRV